MPSFGSMAARVFCTVVLTLACVEREAVSQENMVTILAGTTILVRMLDTVDSSKSSKGSQFTAALETHLAVGGSVIVPAGNTVYGQLASAEQAGRATGSSNLKLELTNIVVNGTAYPISTSDYEVKGSSSGKRSARRLLGGAGLGAAIGAMAGMQGWERPSAQLQVVSGLSSRKVRT
jgi:hypothetical protein